MAIQPPSTQAQVASTPEFTCSICLMPIIKNASGDSRPVAVHKNSSLEEIQKAIFGGTELTGTDSHIFHIGCIRQWQQASSCDRCPLCQQETALWKHNKDLALLAVKEDGMKLKDLSEELRNDKEVVLVAVGENGAAWQYASERLRSDPEVGEKAVVQGGGRI